MKLVGWILGLIACLAVALTVALVGYALDTGHRTWPFHATFGILIWVLPISAWVKTYSIFKTWSEETAQREQLAENRRRSLQAQEEHARRKQGLLEAELRRRTASLSDLLANSTKVFLDLRDLVPTAEHQLVRAQEAFEERAFSPYWDDIENATNSLAAYQRGIALISSSATAYRAEAAQLPTTVQPFDLPIRELPDARPAASRLAASVRKAQRDFQFATIFEQRKTNQILVTGFGTLASVIYEVGSSITSSLADLASSLDRSLADLLSETQESARRAQTAADRHLDSLLDQSKTARIDAAARRKFEREVADRQEQQSRMLDNIQRERRPFP